MQGGHPALGFLAACLVDWHSDVFAYVNARIPTERALLVVSQRGGPVAHDVDLLRRRRSGQQCNGDGYAETRTHTHLLPGRKS
jgi:hypothetical protein